MAERPDGRHARRAVRARPRRADLPDLGADLRLQPVVRALPVVVRPARSARAVAPRSARRSSTSCSACRCSTSTSAAASRRSARTSGSWSTTPSTHQVGVKFSTNGVADHAGAWPRASPPRDYVDVQISLDGATAEVNDPVRGAGSFDMAIRALENLADGRVHGRQDLGRRHPAERRPARRLQGASPTDYGATLRITRLRPSGRGADVWDELHPTAEQQRELYDWLVRARRERADRRLVLPPLRVRRSRCPG